MAKIIKEKNIKKIKAKKKHRKNIYSIFYDLNK